MKINSGKESWSDKEGEAEKRGKKRKYRDRQREGGGEKGVQLIEGAQRSRAGQLSDGCLDSVRGGVAD